MFLRHEIDIQHIRHYPITTNNSKDVGIKSSTYFLNFGI